MTGIYFHIPFCAKKCPYCDFFSIPYHKETTQLYTDAIIRNLHHYAVPDTVDTIYFGGGTPSLLSVSQLSSILDACVRTLHLARDTEITLELNPSGDRREYLQELYKLGINRLSIGTQSFSDEQLRILGRTHTAEKGIRTVHDAADAGFRNISCDLILACPHQSEQVLAETLNVLTALPITHVSSYLLQLEEGTDFSKNTALQKFLPDDDGAADLYLHAVSHLASMDFAQYEVSSFAKAGFESRHNLKYWKCEPYLGIGSGAHSCYEGQRFFVPKDIDAFCRDSHQPTVVIDPAPCQKEERIMLALRTTQGVSRTNFSQDAASLIRQLTQAGYLRNNSEQIILTPKGFAISNSVIAALMEYLIE